MNGQQIGARSKPIRVMIVDDDPWVRNTLAGYISQTDGLEVSDTCANGQEALDRLTESTEEPPVDVVLTDVRMPMLDGIELAARMAAAGLPAKVVVLTTFDEDRAMLASLNAGAKGFLLKDASPEMIAEAILLANSGGLILAPDSAKRLTRNYLPAEEPVRMPTGDELKPVEVTILRALCRAASNAEIAELLSFTVGTVKRHMSSIMTKMGCESRTEVVIRAFEWGLVDPPERTTYTSPGTG